MRASKNPTLDRRQEGERFGLSQFLAGCILQLPLGAQPVHAGRWRGTVCVRRGSESRREGQEGGFG